MAKQFIITAGGNNEHIDNVRKITNSSTGRLGKLIAEEIYKKDPTAKIYYIYGENAVLPKNINGELIEICSAHDAKEKIENIMNAVKIDCVIHSMAVSDYSVNSTFDFYKFKSDILDKGNIDEEKFINAYNNSLIDNTKKMSSSIKCPVITLKQNEKIISMIKKIQPRTFLVGFKLLSNVSKSELFNVAFKLLRKNRCNLVLANDLSSIKQGNHKGMLIYPEKSYLDIEGKENIAKALVENIYKRIDVRHPQSFCGFKQNHVTTNDFKQLQKIGQELFQDGYLPIVSNFDNDKENEGTYGNLSIRNKSGFTITGRNVHKGHLSNDDLVSINRVFNLNENLVYAKVDYSGKIKPSIDSAIHGAIYKSFKCNAIMHIHTNKVYLNLPTSYYNYPCGSEEEKNDIIELLKQNDIIQLYKHGLYIIGETLQDCKQKLELLSNELYIDYDSIASDQKLTEHVNIVNGSNIAKCGKTYSIRYKSNEIGAILQWENNNEINFAIYTYSEGTGLGIVKKYINLWKNKTLKLHTTPKCDIQDFYQNKYGFKFLSQDNNHIVCYKDV